MLTKDVKNSESEILEADDPLLSIDIGRDGIQEVRIFHADGDRIDEQTEAHLLLARIMSQMMLLDDAVKTASQAEVPESSKWCSCSPICSGSASDSSKPILGTRAVIQDGEDL